MLNHITLQGRLTKDIEVRLTNAEIPVASFTLAVDRNHVNGTERIADFIDIVAWRGIAEFASKYFGKGSLMIVEGTLQSRKWQDKNGNNRVNWEVIAERIYFGDSKRQENKEPKETKEPEFEELPNDQDDDFPF